MIATRQLALASTTEPGDLRDLTCSIVGCPRASAALAPRPRTRKGVAGLAAVAGLERQPARQPVLPRSHLPLGALRRPDSASPEHTDRWRAALLGQSSRGSRRAGVRDPRDARRPRRARRRRARRRRDRPRDESRDEVARRRLPHCRLADLRGDAQALADAVALNLIWHARGGWGSRQTTSAPTSWPAHRPTPWRWSDELAPFSADASIRREDRRALRALIFWHLARSDARWPVRERACRARHVCTRLPSSPSPFASPPHASARTPGCV